MKHRLIAFCLVIFLFMVGCAASTGKNVIEKPVALWEKEFAADEIDRIMICFRPLFAEKRDENWSGFGGGQELKPTRLAVLGNSSIYVIELEFDTEIENILNNYGCAVQFQFYICNGWSPRFEIFTTSGLKKAVFFKDLDYQFIYELDNNGSAASILWDTPLKNAVEWLEVRTEKKYIRILFPRKFLPKPASKWWMGCKASGEPYFNCRILVRLALPQMERNPSNIKNLFYHPFILYGSTVNKSSFGLPTKTWLLKKNK